MIDTLAVLAYRFAIKPVFLEYHKTTAWMLDENLKPLVIHQGFLFVRTISRNAEMNRHDKKSILQLTYTSIYSYITV